MSVTILDPSLVVNGSSDGGGDAPTLGGQAPAFYLDRPNHTGVQAIATVTGLQTSLDGKAATNHTHAIADVTGLQTTLDNRLRFDAAQTLTPAQQTQARANFGGGLEYLTDLGTGSTAISTILRPKQAHPNNGGGGGTLRIMGYGATGGATSSHYTLTFSHTATSTGTGSIDLQTTRNLSGTIYSVSGQFSVGVGKGLNVTGNNNIVLGSLKNEFVQTVSGANNLYFLTQETFTAANGTSTGSNNIAISTQSPTLINGSNNIVLGGLPATVDGSNNTILGTGNSYQPTGLNNILLGSGGGSFSQNGQVLISPFTLWIADLGLGVASIRVGNYSSASDLSGNARRISRKELNYLLVQTNPVLGTSYNASSNLSAASVLNTMPLGNGAIDGYIRLTVATTAGNTAQKRAVYKFEGVSHNGSLSYTLTQIDTTSGGDTSGLFAVTLSVVANTLRISAVSNDPATTGAGFTLRLAAYVCAQDLVPDSSAV